jgi:hypothetical protein
MLLGEQISWDARCYWYPENSFWLFDSMRDYQKPLSPPICRQFAAGKNMSEPMVVAFDCETSGLTNDHVILSIGAVTNQFRYFYREVAWEQLYVSTEAMKINQLDLRLRQGIPIDLVLIHLEGWLREQFPQMQGHDILPMGFNVGSFDMRMLRNMYERVKRPNDFPFHYRSIELNSCLMLLGKNKEEFSRDIWKLVKKKFKTMRLNQPAETHNALADAFFAQIAWNELKKEVAELRAA